MRLEINEENRIIKLKEVLIIGKNKRKTYLDMAFDTRTTTSSILPGVAMRLGYNPKKLEKDRVFKYIYVSELSLSNDIFLTDIKLNLLEYIDTSKFGIEGLLGLNFIKQFNTKIDFQQGFIELSNNKID